MTSGYGKYFEQKVVSFNVKLCLQEEKIKFVFRVAAVGTKLSIIFILLSHLSKLNV
jgi:hypothetical protein